MMRKLQRPLTISYVRSGETKKEKECKHFLENSPLAYVQQTIQWRDVIESFDTDNSVFIVVQEQGDIVGILPVYIFRSKHGNIINSVPYPGPIGGVVISPNHPNRELVFLKLMNAVDNLVKKENCVLATIISSPFIPDEEWYRKYFQPTWEMDNYTLYIDLTKPITTTSHFRNNLKRMVNRAAGLGYKVRETQDKRMLERWYEVHKKRHEALGLDPLPEKLVTGILKYLIPENKAKFFVVTKNDKLEAGCLVCYHKSIIDTYMLSGNSTAYRDGAVYLLIDHILSLARKNKFKIFNWQSSKPRGGGPYNFKMQWGSQETPYYFFTKQYGDITPLLKLGLDHIKEEYKWHFVLPYNILSSLKSGVSF